MKIYYCVYCGKPVSVEPFSPCCGEVGHVHEVEVNSVPSNRPMRVFETEVLCEDFDIGLAEAEEIVSRIDMMASPSIVSKSKVGGKHRFLVRSYSLD